MIITYVVLITQEVTPQHMYRYHIILILLGNFGVTAAEFFVRKMLTSERQTVSDLLLLQFCVVKPVASERA